MGIRALLLHFILLFVFSPAIALAQTPAPAPGCTDFRTKEPPFYISSTTKTADKNWTNFQAQPSARSTIGFLPKSSIVRIQPGSQNDLASKGKNVFIPVEVISVPDSNLFQTAAGARQPLKNNVLGKLDKARAGDKGYVAKEVLKHVTGYTFMIREDAPIFSMSDQFKVLAGRALRLKQDPDESFLARQCCVKEATQLRCETRYVFEILSKDLRSVENTIEFNPVECHFCLDFLRPIMNAQLEPIRDIVSMTKPQMGTGVAGLELIDSMGLVKIPIDPTTGVGPFGSLHYSPEKGYAIADDAFADLTTGCTFMRVLEAHQKKCSTPGCQIQWGDIYYPYVTRGGKKEHRSHDDGQCVDIRPLRKSDDDSPIQWSKSAKTDYDVEKTKDLIELLKAFGGDPILFNDKRTGANRWPGHDNHIHVCFDPESPRVQEVCRNSTIPKK